MVRLPRLAPSGDSLEDPIYLRMLCLLVRSLKWNKDVEFSQLCDASWLELVFHFGTFSGLDMSLRVGGRIAIGILKAISWLSLPAQTLMMSNAVRSFGETWDRQCSRLTVWLSRNPCGGLLLALKLLALGPGVLLNALQFPHPKLFCGASC